MKKISTLLVAAATMAFSASAVEPTTIPIANFSFEEANAEILACDHLTGWTIMGSDAMTVNDAGEAQATYLYAYQQRTASWTNGNFGIRSGAAVDLTGANYIYQSISTQKPGVYVLQFDGRTARRNWKNNLGANFDMAFIYDNYGSLDEIVPGEATDEGTTILWSHGHPNENGWFNSGWPRYYLIHKTSPDTFLDEETDICFGFGFPASQIKNENDEIVNIAGAQIACDNFVLHFFDTEDIEEAKTWVNAEIAKIEAGDYSNPTVPTGGTDPEPVPMSVANGTFNVTIGTFVTNSGWEDPSGINDIAAPVVKNNKYYNLQGIEIAEPTEAGLYIHNGKKYIVR